MLLPVVRRLLLLVSMVLVLMRRVLILMLELVLRLLNSLGERGVRIRVTMPVHARGRQRCTPPRRVGASRAPRRRCIGARVVVLRTRLETRLVAFREDVIHHVVESPVSLKLQEPLVEKVRMARVLDRVVLLCLDVLLQQEPRQEAEGELAAASGDGVDVDCVKHLFRRNEDV